MASVHPGAGGVDAANVLSVLGTVDTVVSDLVCR